ncbi:unnamed protein product [Leptosia nina]|uniref:Neural cell expressed developmentally down-regulated protein 1 n=1 Tax=Leptosia nina TaxID=320188 RepID=A0AAV1JXF9_9NEOP
MYLSSISSHLLLYDTNSWEVKYSYGKSEGILKDVSWSDDSKYILLVNPKGAVEILSPAIQNLTLQHVPIEESSSATFQRDGHQNIAVGTQKGEVIIWDAKNKAKIKTFPTSPNHTCVNILSFNAKNTSVAATMQNGDTVIYGLATNIPVSTVKLNCSKSISAMKFHHEARSLLGLATDEGHVILRDITTNKDKATFEDSHASPVTDFVFSLINKDVMLSCGYDKSMQVYDIRQKNVVSTLKTPYALTALAINSENHVALGSQKGHVLLYDLRDLTSPYKVLKGHDNKVQKVAFQPPRKKFFSPDLSLVDRLDIYSPAKASPLRNCSSDMFFANNTPPKPTEVPPTEAEDSFLLMMGMRDKTNDGIDSDANKSFDSIGKIDQIEFRLHQIDMEKNISKSSTPIVNKTTEHNSLHPMLHNAVSEGRISNGRAPNITNPKQNSLRNDAIIDDKAIEDLKDFMKLNLSYVTDENKNSFLHIMMALTKQNLYLEKQLSNMNNRLLSIQETQTELLEINRNLAIEIYEMKNKHNLNNSSKRTL